jgi:hypothetical protein
MVDKKPPKSTARSEAMRLAWERRKKEKTDESVDTQVLQGETQQESLSIKSKEGFPHSLGHRGEGGGEVVGKGHPHSERGGEAKETKQEVKPAEPSAFEMVPVGHDKRMVSGPEHIEKPTGDLASFFDSKKITVTDITDMKSTCCVCHYWGMVAHDWKVGECRVFPDFKLKPANTPQCGQFVLKEENKRQCAHQ